MTLQRISPIFPVRDLHAALEHYRRLGFDTRADGGGSYGFAARDAIEIHLGTVTAGNVSTSPASAYLHVADADALAREWQLAGGDVHPPVDTDWGRHEGALVDPDGNVIRFGSPTPAPPPSARS
jgi:predicted enzyme related to lactoylglutathione lyase